MISCEVQTSYTFIERELAQIGHNSCHFAIKLKESARFTHFNLQFQQISRVPGGTHNYSSNYIKYKFKYTLRLIKSKKFDHSDLLSLKLIG